MNHLNYEFDAEAGNVAEVTLDRAANVLLMDSSNYNEYKQGRIIATTAVIPPGARYD